MPQTYDHDLYFGSYPHQLLEEYLSDDWPLDDDLLRDDDLFTTEDPFKSLLIHMSSSSLVKELRQIHNQFVDGDDNPDLRGRVCAIAANSRFLSLLRKAFPAQGDLDEASIQVLASFMRCLLSRPGNPPPRTLGDVEKVIAAYFPNNSEHHAIDYSKYGRLRDRPGGRPGNDNVDFRKVRVAPQLEELDRDAFLPPPDHEFLNDHLHARLLDRSFRLLREDELDALRDDTRSKPEIIFSRFSYNRHREKSCAMRFRIQKGHKRLARSRGSRILLEHRKLKVLGLVVYCSSDDDKRPTNQHFVDIECQGQDSLYAMLRTIPKRTPFQVLGVSSNASIKVQVLESLKNMKTIPFAQEFFLAEQCRLLSDNKARELVKKHAQKSGQLTLDEVQVGALVECLAKRIGVVQGPPGTGKSVVGTAAAVALVKGLNETVLCVCETNHALDQFLEGLLSKGLDLEDMVRIGGGCKHPEIEKRNLFQLQRRTPPRRVFRVVADELESHAKWLNENTCMLVTPENLTQSQAKMLLERALRRPRDSLLHPLLLACGDCKSIIAEFWPPEQDLDDDGFKQKKGAAKLFPKWKNGKSVGKHPVWQLSQEDRRSILESWCDALHRETAEKLLDAGCLRQRLEKAKRKQLGVATVCAMMQAKVIACTVSGFFKYKSVIQQSRCANLLLEEAGEILEAHFVAMLHGMDFKRVIMIGDHQQLRPKVNSHKLSVDSGYGLDFNRSTFERLVLSGYPFKKLTTQHRMSPAIAALVSSSVYPDLKNGPSVFEREPVKGIRPGIRVLFLDHREPEKDHNGAGYSNVHEAELCASIVKYLLQQHYSPNQLVVLTPYLSQLVLLRKKLVNPKIGTSDLEELDEKERDDQNQASVRLATVDNYQGEESDIVVASLVRSNTRANIGFLKCVERVTVLLTRARCGLILVGNQECFGKAGAWAPVLERSTILPHFPAVCTIHETKRMLRTKDDFEKQAPHGGCDQPCREKLACGHPCPSLCHPRTASQTHERLEPCMVEVLDTCKFGHKTTRKCSRQVQECRTCTEEHVAQKRAQRDKEKYDQQVAELEVKLQNGLREKRRNDASAAEMEEWVEDKFSLLDEVVGEAASELWQRSVVKSAQVMRLVEESMKELHSRFLDEKVATEKVDEWKERLQATLGALPQDTVECTACGDSFQQLRGMGCRKKHFMCRECLAGYVASLAADNKTGQLGCPVCKEEYSSQALAMNLDGESHKQVEEMIANGIRKIAIQEREADLEKQRAKSEKRKAIDQVLELPVLSCPRCKVPFVWVDGCCALTCTEENCKTYFCGICRSEFPSDRQAHAHIEHCPFFESSNLPFGTPEDIVRATGRYLTDAITRKLQDLPGNIRMEVLEECIGALQGQEIDFDQIRAKLREGMRQV